VPFVSAVGARLKFNLTVHDPYGGASSDAVTVTVVNSNDGRRITAWSRCRLAFYRDPRGTEIDLVLEHARALLAVEIKSGQTVASSFFEGFAAFEEALSGGKPKQKKALSRIVGFGGEHGQRRSDVLILAWRELADFDWQKEE
jgi:hypothetical protein